MLNFNYTLFPTFYGCYEEDVPIVLYANRFVDIRPLADRVSLLRYAADAPYTEYSNITALSE